MVKKIISHLPPRHLDDFLGIALMKFKNPKAKIEFVHPQNVPAEYLTDPEIALIDVGGDYNPQLKNYDHHHDINLPSSVYLVLLGEFADFKPIVRLKSATENFDLEKILNSQTLLFIDLTDRYGAKKASELTQIMLDKKEDGMRKEILLIDLQKYGYEVGRTAIQTLSTFQIYSEWLQNFYESLDSQGFLDEPRAIIKKEEEAFYEKLAKSRAIEIGGLKVIVSSQSFAPFHYKVFEMGAELIIERNSLNPKHTSIIKNTSNPKTSGLDLSGVFEIYPKIFLHPNGFIAVVDAEIDTIDPNLIVNQIKPT